MVRSHERYPSIRDCSNHSKSISETTQEPTCSLGFQLLLATRFRSWKVTEKDSRLGLFVLPIGHPEVWVAVAEKLDAELAHRPRLLCLSLLVAICHIEARLRRFTMSFSHRVPTGRAPSELNCSNSSHGMRFQPKYFTSYGLIQCVVCFCLRNAAWSVLSLWSL